MDEQFEAWWRTYGYGPYSRADLERAFAAGRSSRDAEVERLRGALKQVKTIFEKDYYFGHPTARNGISIIDAALSEGEQT